MLGEERETFFEGVFVREEEVNGLLVNRYGGVVFGAEEVKRKTILLDLESG